MPNRVQMYNTFCLASLPHVSFAFAVRYKPGLREKSGTAMNEMPLHSKNSTIRTSIQSSRRLMDFFVTNSETNKIKRASDHGCDKVVNTSGNKPVCWDNFSNFSKKNFKIFSHILFFQKLLEIILTYSIL